MVAIIRAPTYSCVSQPIKISVDQLFVAVKWQLRLLGKIGPSSAIIHNFVLIDCQLQVSIFLEKVMMNKASSIITTSIFKQRQSYTYYQQKSDCKYFYVLDRQSKGEFANVFLQSVNEGDLRKFSSVDDTQYTVLVETIK